MTTVKILFGNKIGKPLKRKVLDESSSSFQTDVHFIENDDSDSDNDDGTVEYSVQVVFLTITTERNGLQYMCHRCVHEDCCVQDATFVCLNVLNLVENVENYK